MLRLSRLVLKPRKGAKLAPPAAPYTVYCDKIEDERLVFDWAPVEEFIEEKIDDFKDSASDVHVSMDMTQLEELPVDFEEDGEIVEFSISDIALITKLSQREYKVDLAEYPDLFQKVSRLLETEYGKFANIQSDRRKVQVFINLPKITQQTRKARVTAVKSQRATANREIASITEAVMKGVEIDIKEDEHLKSLKDMPYFAKTVREFLKQYKAQVIIPKLNRIESENEARLMKE